MSQRRRANLLSTPVNETPLSLRCVHRLRRFKTEPRVFPPSPPLIVEQQERLWALSFFLLSRRAFVMIIPNPNRLLIYSADNWMLDNRSCPLCPLVKTWVSSKWCVGISPVHSELVRDFTVIVIRVHCLLSPQLFTQCSDAISQPPKLPMRKQLAHSHTRADQRQGEAGLSEQREGRRRSSRRSTRREGEAWRRRTLSKHLSGS